MSVEFAAMLALLVAGALMRLPIGIALISASIAYLWMRGLPLVAVTNTVMQGFSSNFVFLAIPLFIFAAQVMNVGTITDRLLGFAVAVAGRTKGGLAQVNVITSLIFSGMSGSATADAAGVGTVLVKMMRKNDRYPAGFAGAVTAASSVIGPIFPPSIPMIYYAISADTSVGALFLGGIIPALFITVAMMVLNSVIARRRNFPIEPAQSSGEIFTQLRIAMLPLLTPFILLGGIYSDDANRSSRGCRSLRHYRFNLLPGAWIQGLFPGIGGKRSKVCRRGDDHRRRFHVQLCHRN